MHATLVCCIPGFAQRSYTIGTGGGGQSQQISKEIQAQLPPYEPVLQEPVSLTHKRGGCNAAYCIWQQQQQQQLLPPSLIWGSCRSCRFSANPQMLRAATLPCCISLFCCVS